MTQNRTNRAPSSSPRLFIGATSLQPSLPLHTESPPPPTPGLALRAQWEGCPSSHPLALLWRKPRIWVCAGRPAIVDSEQSSGLVLAPAARGPLPASPGGPGIVIPEARANKGSSCSLVCSHISSGKPETPPSHCRCYFLERTPDTLESHGRGREQARAMMFNT